MPDFKLPENSRIIMWQSPQLALPGMEEDVEPCFFYTHKCVFPARYINWCIDFTGSNLIDVPRDGSTSSAERLEARMEGAYKWQQLRLSF